MKVEQKKLGQNRELIFSGIINELFINQLYIFIARKTSHVFLIKSKLKRSKLKGEWKKGWIIFKNNNKKFQIFQKCFQNVRLFSITLFFIRISKITQVVSCVRGGHSIMLVICKVLVFTKFHFHEPFYLYVNYFTCFVFAETNNEDGSWCKWNGRQVNCKR